MELPVLEEQVDAARRAGAKGCEMLLESTSGVDLVLDAGKLVDRTEVSSHKLTVTTWLEGGRRGQASGSPGALTTLVQRSLEAAGKARESAHGGPVDRLRPVVGGLSVEDRRYKYLDDQGRVDVIQMAARSVRSESKEVRLGRFTYRDRAVERRFANSRGVSLEERSTRYDARGEVLVGELKLSEAIASRSFASIASLPFGTALARRAVALMVDGETLDGEVPVMMPPHVVAQLVAFLGPYFVPERLAGTKPFFLARQDGEPVVDSRLHVLDDGRIPGGLHTRSFDDRGVVPVPLTLLKEGVPDGAYRGPEAARRDGHTPTGHELKGKQVPGNLALRSGTKTVNHTWTDFGGWSLRLDSLDPSGLDLATGVLETPVNGLVMHSNEPKGAVRNRMARLDLLQMLNAVREVCSDTDRVGHVDAPALFLDGLVLL